MTKEELRSNILGYLGYCDGATIDRIDENFREFFSQNVVIPRGKNRHPNADVLHLWLEGVECEKWFDNYFVTMPNAVQSHSHKEYRIKPSEPIYEYKVCMYFNDGTFEHTEKYFTKEEYQSFGFPSSCILDSTIQRIRQ